MVDRIPPFVQLTNSPEEQDYPTAVVDKSGSVWMAYLEFRHNKDHDRLRANLRAANGPCQVTAADRVQGRIRKLAHKPFRG